MLRVDGSYGEGGGQILRSSLTLSLLTGKAFELVNIRAKRPKPGLRPQHLTCVKAAQKISQAEVEGARIGSLYLRFVPGKIRPGAYTFEIGTAGATGLVFQTVALPLAQAGAARLILKGGTHVPYAPCFHYLAKVYAPVLHLLGYEFELELRRYGFYPAGGGEVKASINPRRPARDLTLKGPFKPEKVEVISVVSEDLPSHIRTRQAKQATEILTKAGLAPLARLEKARSSSPGTLVFVWAEDGVKRVGFFSLGKKGKPAEKVAEEAVYQFLDFLKTGAAVDPYLSDQLLLPAAINPVKTCFESARLTRHFFTNLWVINQFLPEIEVKVLGEEGLPGRVELVGVNLK